MITLSEFAKKLLNEKRVAVIMHVRPDGDTVGSALAITLALRQKGISADPISFDPIPERFSYLPSVKEVKRDFDGEYSAYFYSDCADNLRVGELSEIKSANTYNLDHHVSNTRYAKYNYVVDNASNCENAYELLCEINAEINPELANLLATGVVTDTGNFSHKNVTENTLLVASKLFSFGADLNRIYYFNFKSQTKARAKLHGIVMNKIRYFYDDKIAVITISQKDLKETNAKADETEGFIDFVMGINGVGVAISVMEIEENKYKISFRSKKTDVNAVAGTFGGGGHVLASGCQISGEYEEVIDKVVSTTKRFFEE